MSGSRAPDKGVTIAEQVLVLVTLGLVGFGLVMVYSASSASAMQEYGDSLFFLKRDAFYALIGLAAFGLCTRLDYRTLGRLAPMLLVVAVALMVLVAFAGVTVNGARRWLPVGPFTFQPSELAKLGLLLYASTQLAGRRPPGDWREVMRPVGAATAVLCGLAMLQRDLGSAMGIAIAAGAVLLVSGARAGALARVGGVAAALATLAIWSEPYRRERFLAFVNPWADPDDTGYQLVQAAYAFGSGGLFGVGLGQGVEKNDYLPEAHTDMIFAIIGEELGLFGVLCLIAAFAALAWAGFTIAMRAKDPVGKRLAAGVTALIVGQAAINFGGVLSMLPLTGVPVPLVSYGGTSLVTTLMGLGLVLSVAAHGRAVARQPVRAVPDPAVSRAARPGAPRGTARAGRGSSAAAAGRAPRSAPRARRGGGRGRA